MPPTPTLAQPTEIPTRRFKMKLLQSEYMVNVSGNEGRYPAGAVLLADESTAVRWYERGIAEPAPPDAETYGEVRRRNKRAEFDRLAQPVEEVFDQAVSRGSFNGERQLMPPPMPVPGRRRAPGRNRPDLAGAEVVNTIDGDEDDTA